LNRKLQKPKVITHDIEFHTAALNKQVVAVYMKTNLELIEHGGLIEDISADSIKINGNYFMRENCEFWI